MARTKLTMEQKIQTLKEKIAILEIGVVASKLEAEKAEADAAKIIAKAQAKAQKARLEADSAEDTLRKLKTEQEIANLQNAKKTCGGNCKCGSDKEVTGNGAKSPEGITSAIENPKHSDPPHPEESDQKSDDIPNTDAEEQSEAENDDFDKWASKTIAESEMIKDKLSIVIKRMRDKEIKEEAVVAINDLNELIADLNNKDYGWDEKEVEEASRYLNEVKTEWADRGIEFGN